MKYVFGPVPSRRLGRSLGVDLVPMKTCTLSCRYCQIGETPTTTLERKPWIPIDFVLQELKERLAQIQPPDWISFSGSGEPTLNSDIGSAIAAAKTLTDIPVCVITNGTLLWMPEVRDALLPADTILPSLDSAIEDTFQKLCEPAQGLTAAKIIDGLIQFRNNYNGVIWLEILIAKNYNDSEQEVTALADAVSRIKPDAVHLNTVVRPPADSQIQPVTFTRLEEISKYFDVPVEIIASFKQKTRLSVEIDPDAILAYLRRRPGSVDDIAVALETDTDKVIDVLSSLQDDGGVRQVSFHGKEYWEVVRS